MCFLFTCRRDGLFTGIAEGSAAYWSLRAGAGPVFRVDPLTAGSISGTIRYAGKRLRPTIIDMSEDPACVEAHRGKSIDESLLVSSNGALANAFVYVKKGLEGKSL